MSMSCLLKFTKSEDEQLVTIVAEHDFLWDASSTDFKNVLKRDKIWNEIGELINKPGVQCKNRWRNIKDHYKRQKKIEKNPDSTFVPRKRALYWERLQFLDNVPDERDSFTSTQNSHEDSITVQILPELFIDVDTDPHPDDNSGEATLLNDHPKTSTKKRKQDASQNGNMSELKNKRYRQDRELTSILEKQEEERKYLEKFANPDEDDEIDLFFKSMAATVKMFSPDLRTDTKLEVMQTVCKFERRNNKSFFGSFLSEDEN